MGWGGHQGGDIASQMAVKVLPEFFQAHQDLSPTDLVKNGVLEVNNSILEYSRKNALLKGMGTTLVLLYFDQTNLYIGNVGDSRAYLINKGLLYQLSRDHSLIQEKINLGIYGRQEGAKDKMKNVLVRTVGFEDKLDVDVFTYKVSKNDLFLICSDGLHGKVSDRDLVFLVNKNIPEPEKATCEQLTSTAKSLIDLANHNGGQDNSSVILAVVQ